MNTSNKSLTSLPISSAEELEKQLCRAAEILKQLRSAVVARKKSTRKNLGEFATELDVPPSTLTRLIDPHVSTFGENMLKVATHMGKSSLGLELMELSKSIDSKDKILVILSPAARQTVVHLKQSYNTFDRKGKLGFRKIFGPQKKLIDGIIKFKKTDLLQLEDETTRTKILEVLTDPKLEKRIAKSLVHPEQTSEHTQSFVLMHEALKQHFTSDSEMSRQLGLSRATIKNALVGKASLNTKRRLMKNARELIAKLGIDGQKHSPPAIPVLSTNHRADVMKHTGATSKSGVQYTLDSDSFQKMRSSVSPNFVKLASEQLELTRALLNVCAQIEDDDERGKIRAQLGPEVEELRLTIEFFSEKHPNGITSLMEGQREVWAKAAKKLKQQKGSS